MADPVEVEDKPKSPLEHANDIRDVIKAAQAKDVEEVEDDDPNEEEEVEDSTDGEEDVEDVNDDDTEEEDLDDKAKDKEDKSDSKVRFTQYKGDGKPETYTKNLEDAYYNSSQEAIKLKDAAETASNERDIYKTQVEAIKEAVGKDPEFAEKVIALLDEASKNAPADGGTKTTDSDNPYVKDAETKWKQDNDKSAEEFASRNPEVLDDPVLAEKVKKLVKKFGADIYADEKRLPLSGELMEKAFGYLGLTVKKSDTQELADGMKGLAAPTRKQTPSKKKSVTSKQFSNLTLDISKKMNISKERLEKNGKN